jgi:hypothetical protein
MSWKDHFGRFMGDGIGMARMARMATELSDLVECGGSPPRNLKAVPKVTHSLIGWAAGESANLSDHRPDLRL